MFLGRQNDGEELDAVPHRDHLFSSNKLDARVFCRLVGYAFGPKLCVSLPPDHSRHLAAGITKELGIRRRCGQEDLVLGRREDLDLVLASNLDVELIAFTQKGENHSPEVL